MSTSPYEPWLEGDTGGPRVSYDPLTKPFPTAPIPNDSATRFDPSSLTGRRLNVSMESATAHNREVRRALNDLDGWGVFSPLSIPFEGPLDLRTVHSGSVLLVNISEGSARYGELAPLDLGAEPGEVGGYFPLKNPLEWFYGPRPDPLPPTLLFPADNSAETDEEPGVSPLTHYEVASNSLIAKPLKPLAHGATYAALITKEVHGWSDPERTSYGVIGSPFGAVASVNQLEGVKRGAQLAGLDLNELAFGWTFTTGDPTSAMRSLRAGLYERGQLKAIGSLAPAQLTDVRSTDIETDDPDNPRDTVFILRSDFLAQFTALVAEIMGNEGYAIQFPDVDYFVFGSFQSPQLRRPMEQDPHEPSWLVGPDGLSGTPELKSIPFFLSVPKASPASEPPFPVVIYFHGTNSSRMEGLLLTQELARQGIALISFDQVGHGPMIANVDQLDQERPDLRSVLNVLPLLLARLFAPHLIPEVTGVGYQEGMAILSGVGIYKELTVYGRGVDVNQDGYRDAAEGFFAADPLTLCGSFWQDLIDGMQLVKILRSMSPSKVPAYLNRPREADPARLNAHLLAGDFNADGVLDIGGPDVQLSTAGTSLGGIHALLFAAVEPEVTVATPIVPGGGLVDILMRSDLRFIAGPLFLEYLGQAVVGCQHGDRLHLSLGDASRRCEFDDEERAFAILDGGWEGYALRLINLRTGEERQGQITASGFAIQVATDRLDPLALQIEDPNTGALVERFELEAEVHGAGYAPHTPDFRVASQSIQHLLDRCDPISFAERMTDPLPGDGPPNKVLMMSALGDQAVPVSAAIHLANALKLLGRDEREWRPRLDVLRDRNVIAGEPWGPALDPSEVSDEGVEVPLYDVEDVRDDNPDAAPPIGPLPPIQVGDGLSALRLADVEGKHEWVAGYRRDGFNYALRSLRQIAAFHRCGGRVILDEEPECLQAEDCTLFNTLYLREDCQWAQP